MLKSLKILVLAQYFPPDMGGASARASNVVKGLLEKGCEVKVVTAFPHYPNGNVPKKCRHKAIISEKAGDAEVWRVWIPALPHSSIVNRVILHLCFIFSSFFALFFVGDFDIVWAANPNLFCFYSAVFYGFVNRKPIVRNVDDLWPEVFYELGVVRSRLMQKVLDFLAWLSYVVPVSITPISAGYKRRIVKKYGVSAEKVHVVEVGVDRVEPLNAREDVYVDGRFTVMYSGVLGVGYDFDVILDAARILEKMKEIVFVIRGVGELASKLQKRIKESNVKNVILDSSFLSKDELSALLSSADVFVLPMTCTSLVDEGLPAKVFEYQAYGKPIVCISDGEPAKYVKSTESGLVVKPNDAHGLADAVVGLYSDRKLASELGWKGQQHVSKHLTTKKIGERMYGILASVVPSKN